MPEYSKSKRLKDGSRNKIINDNAALLREAKLLKGPNNLRKHYETKGAQQVADELRDELRVLINEVTDLRRELGYKPNVKIVGKKAK